MRQTILQGLEQAYSNLVHMIADFLPRFLVMLIIIVLGLLVAFVLKYILRTVLGLTKLDRVSEEAGASRILRIAHLPSMTVLLSRSIFLANVVRFHFDRPQRPRRCQSPGADFAVISVPARSVRRDLDIVRGLDDGELFIPDCASCRGQCGASFAKNP